MLRSTRHSARVVGAAGGYAEDFRMTRRVVRDGLSVFRRSMTAGCLVMAVVLGVATSFHVSIYETP